jgi:eukaryotic-like serine/threonine-protein kinase
MPVPLKAREVLQSRYQIKRIIGQGGMGSIYLTDDLILKGRQCALKEVEHDRSLDAKLLQEARDQFLREATTLARLDHPNLPKVSDFFSIENRDYLVMDFVPGKDLRTLIIEAREANQFLAENDVLDWANQLSDALEHLHGQDPPVVHRDIKPSNLKLTPSGILKLVDFGLVKVLSSGEVTITIIQGQGTALYTPLEQYGGDGGHTDVRSDIFSFGATLYHLLTNRPPPDARQRFLNHDSLISIRQVNPAVSLRTERAIFVAMSLHPDDRPASVSEFRQNLISGRPITRRSTTTPSNGLLDVFRSPVERNLLYLTILLTVFSLIITLLR